MRSAICFLAGAMAVATASCAYSQALASSAASTPSSAVKYLVQSDYERSIRKASLFTPSQVAALREKADAGDPASEYLLALAYDRGYGTATDLKQALVWYRKAAEAGFGMAENQLGRIYDDRGPVRDTSEALKWYRRAAAHGDSVAEANVGALMEELKQPEGISWTQTAAAHGNFAAMGHLVDLFKTGKMVAGSKDENHAAGVLYLRGLAAEGDANAQCLLGEAYLRHFLGLKSEADAVIWMGKSANAGQPFAENYMGYMYMNGEGVPRDYAKGVEWYQKAAAHWLARAQANLGYVYEFGKGVPRDRAIAYMWYLLAADGGLDVTHQFNSEHKGFSLYGKLTSQETADARRRADEWKAQHLD